MSYALFRLTAFLCADARIGTRGVDQRHDRDVKMIGHGHQPRSLAIAFRPGHAEIVLEPTVGVRSLFMTDDADALAAETTEAADDRFILAVLAVAGERHEIGDQRRDVVEAMRPLRVARHLRFLPRRQFAVELLERLRGLAFDAGDLFAACYGIAVGLQRAQFLDLGL